MRVYKVIFEQGGHYYSELIVIANKVDEAIRLAREELGDKEEILTLYDISSYDTGIVSRRGYY